MTVHQHCLQRMQKIEHQTANSNASFALYYSFVRCVPINYAAAQLWPIVLINLLITQWYNIYKKNTWKTSSSYKNMVCVCVNEIQIQLKLERKSIKNEKTRHTKPEKQATNWTLMTFDTLIWNLHTLLQIESHFEICPYLRNHQRANQTSFFFEISFIGTSVHYSRCQKQDDLIGARQKIN